MLATTVATNLSAMLLNIVIEFMIAPNNESRRQLFKFSCVCRRLGFSLILSSIMFAGQYAQAKLWAASFSRIDAINAMFISSLVMEMIVGHIWRCKETRPET